MLVVQLLSALYYFPLNSITAGNLPQSAVDVQHPFAALCNSLHRSWTTVNSSSKISIYVVSFVCVRLHTKWPNCFPHKCTANITVNILFGLLILLYIFDLFVVVAPAESNRCWRMVANVNVHVNFICMEFMEYTKIWTDKIRIVGYKFWDGGRITVAIKQFCDFTFA